MPGPSFSSEEAAGCAAFWVLGIDALDRPALAPLRHAPVRVAVAVVTALVIGALFAWLFRPSQTLRRGLRSWLTASRRSTGPAPLFGSMAAAVVVGLALAVAATWAVSGVIVTRESAATPVDVVRAAFPAMAGAVVAVALVLVYRRQKDSEPLRFAQRFGAASTQLGDADVAFARASFSSAESEFTFTKFKCLRASFDSPAEWRNVEFDWDNAPAGSPQPVPRCITPRPWPPSLAKE